jgi:hypothetical protein
MADHAGRVRDRTVLVLVLVLTAACLVAITPRPASGAHDRDAPRRWVGYRIPRTGTAAGGWIGGYRLDGARLFVTTPKKRRNRAGHEPAQYVEDLRDSRGASRAETARAAWILSKYGGYRDATQAAAVDAAVTHLLAGKRWRISARLGSRRIRQAPESAAVRRFARIMLAGSRRSAGAYHAVLQAAGADVGGTLEVAVAVTDGHGRPAPGLPVVLGAGGAAPVDAVTGDDGRAVARFTVGQRGWQDVSATVQQVPEHRLVLRPPVRPRQSTAAEGGIKQTLSVGGQAPVRGPQALSLAPSPGTVTTGSSTRVVATVAGDGVPRTASGQLHGPFASAAAAQCTGTAAAGVTATVAADGAHALPPVTPRAGGYYAWRVAVDGTATSLPVSTCGAATKVLGRSVTSVTGPSSASASSNVQATATLSGLPFPARADLTVLLFGPYASDAERSADACSSPLSDSVSLSMVGNGSLATGPVFVEEPGFYAWQAQTSAGDLWQGSRSPCLASGTLMWVG